MSERKDSFVEYLHQRYIGDDPERLAELEQARLTMRVAQLVYDLRQEAGLTQRQLAERVGTSPSVISRLEADDYRGHSLSMLRRIAAAVGKRVEIRFVDDPEARRA
jgi:ribosome-binding protein aMBF1 (putative translation factor)